MIHHGPIFTNFHHLIVVYRPNPIFPITQEMLLWQPILWLKMGLGIPKRLEYRNADFERFNVDDLATSFKNLVSFGPVTPKFKRGKDVHSQLTIDFCFRCLSYIRCQMLQVNAQFVLGCGFVWKLIALSRVQYHN